MKHTQSRGFRSFMVSCLTALLTTGNAWAAEVTIPSQMNEVIKPELANKYIYTEDGEYTKALGIPTYKWMPANNKPDAIILGIHGLTLHGRRFRVIARAFAVQGYGFVSMDMRGFGRCKFDDKKQFSTPQDDKSKINHEKSFYDIVHVAELVRSEYPGIPIVAMGESLGCTFCVRLAGERQDLVDGLILSAPAVRVNPAMYMSAKDIESGLKALLSRHHEMDLNQFITHLVSTRPEVVQEMLDDPLILKKVSLGDLLSTDSFVSKTEALGKKVHENLPVLILQGGGDRCVSPKAVTDLMMNMPSCNQTLAWMGPFGHLQLETSYFRAKVMDILAEWIENRTREANDELKSLEQNVDDLGGTLVR